MCCPAGPAHGIQVLSSAANGEALGGDPDVFGGQWWGEMAATVLEADLAIPTKPGILERHTAFVLALLLLENRPCAVFAQADKIHIQQCSLPTRVQKQSTDWTEASASGGTDK